MDPAVIVSLVVGPIGVALGIHAAIVSRRALVLSRQALDWQQERDRERSETRLVVWFNHEGRPLATDPRATFLMGGVQFLPMDYWLTLVTYNAGETTEYLSELVVEDVRGRAFRVEEFQPDQAIRPRERVTRSFVLPGPPFDPGDGFVGRVRLAGGDEVASDVDRLEPRIVEIVHARNTRGALDRPPPPDEQMPDVTDPMP